MNYKIQQGDSLSKIGKKYNVSVADLAKANNIDNINLITTGKTLIIPGAKEDKTPAAKTAFIPPTKAYTPESDMTNTHNPVTGMQFNNASASRFENPKVSTSIPYESKNTSGFPAVKTTSSKQSKGAKSETKVVDKNAPPISMIYGQPASQDNTNVIPVVAGRE
jgi:murein DD-endopeptidase MepM/ murein hydrolase activator NlpD